MSSLLDQTSHVSSGLQKSEWLSAGEVDTDRLGLALAEVLQGGEVIALNGPLGAGKTRFVRSLAVGLGCDPQLVNSPTFVLLQEYPGRLTVAHLDAYRLRDSDEFLELGVEELWQGNCVCLIEWASRVADVLPRDRLTIDIEVLTPQSRRFCLSASGPNSSARLVALGTNLGNGQQ